jgi:hypothetical protein
VFKDIYKIFEEETSNQKLINFYKRSLLLVFLNVYFSFIPEVNAADNAMQALVNPAVGINLAYITNIRNSYEDLRTFQNNLLNGLPAQNDNISKYLEKIDRFKVSLYQVTNPANRFTNQEYTELLRVLESAYANINTFINQYHLPAQQRLKAATRGLFNDTLLKIDSRYRLANIERKIVNNNAWIGLNVNNNIPDGGARARNIFRNTINRLTGRIFVVDPNGGNPIIKSFSSGMILPRVVQGSKVYDTIITCGHCMDPGDTNPELEYYFVRTEVLDPSTGVPDPVVISNVIGGGAAVNTQTFIQYLRAESIAGTNNVRLITRFQAFTPPHTPIHTESNLSDHSPRYRPYQDNGYGRLNQAFNFGQQRFANINMLNALPAGGGPFQYYAFGYPGFPYFNTAGQSTLVRELKFHPFTMSNSRSDANDAGHIILAIMNNNNLRHGELRHGAHTMKGMSGGPILRFNPINNTIDVLGVVQSGSFNTSYGSKFW